MNNDINALPVDFDGVFRFTNFTDRDFKARWNSIEYTFPAQKSTPMIIPGATPEEVQTIRKKFARELAEREFYETPKFVHMNAPVPGGTPALYTDGDLAPFIQKCLDPLPIAQATIKTLPKDKDTNYSKSTKIVQQGESLMSNNSDAIE